MADKDETPKYTFKKDYTEQLTDGTGWKLLFRAGESVSWETAKALGLVTGEPPKAADEKPAAKAEK